MAATEDVLSSPACLFLDEQVAAGLITAAQAEHWKSLYVDLHRTDQLLGERELEARSKAADLKTGVTEELIAVEKARLKKEELDGLSEAAEGERRKAAAVVTELESKESALQVEANELKLREAELSEDVAQLRRDNEALVTPALQGLVTQIADARAELARTLAAEEGLAASKAELRAKIDSLRQQADTSKAAGGVLRVEYAKAQSEPSRLTRQVDSVKTAIEELEQEAARLRTALGALASNINEQDTAVKGVAEVRKGVEAKLNRYRADIEAKELEAQALERNYRTEKAQHKDLLERRVELRAQDDTARTNVHLAATEMENVNTAYERSKRRLKQRMQDLDDASAMVSPLEATAADHELELKRLADQFKRCDVELAATRREADVLVARYIKEESVEKVHREKLSELVTSCASLEHEKDQWHREEDLARKQIAALKAQRDNKSREVSKTIAARKATVEQSRMRELQLIDLAKELADSGNKLKQYSSLYDIAKSERNSYATAIQSTAQSIAEMRERIKILSNEVDILQNESSAKDKALQKEQTAHTTAAAQRDLLRVEANRAASEYREKQTLVEQQILQIDKLSSIINSLEKDMMILKMEYEGAVEMRNYTGIQLIDRNDELCILYEKSNIHEKTYNDAQIALRGIVEEMRSLKIVAADLRRQLNTAKGKLPDTSVWAERILELQGALVSSKQITEKLSAQLEKPSNADRWVALEGEDPDTDQLRLRVSQLEQRLDAAREELLGKELSLEEVAGLTDRLRAELDAPAQGTEATALALAQQLNEAQAKVKDMNKRMMALVSELSMYQAHAIRLSSDSIMAAETLQKAEQDMARGLPPSVAAQQRLSLMERSRAPAPKPEPPSDGPKSTAVQRANAYAPEGLGLPKPYGEFPPFQPSAPGASMRHFRPPMPREPDM